MANARHQSAGAAVGRQGARSSGINPHLADGFDHDSLAKAYPIRAAKAHPLPTLVDQRGIRTLAAVLVPHAEKVAVASVPGLGAASAVTPLGTASFAAANQAIVTATFPRSAASSAG